MNADSLFEYIVSKRHWSNEANYPYDLLCLLYPDEILKPDDKSDLESLIQGFEDRKLLIKEDWLDEEIQREVKDISEFNRKVDMVSIILIGLIFISLGASVIAFLFLPVAVTMKTRVVIAAAIFFVLVVWIYLVTRKSRSDVKALEKRVSKDSSAIKSLEEHVTMMDQCICETRKFIDERSK